MALTLNTCYPLQGKYIQAWHYPFISFAGPVITLVQSVVFYLMNRQSSNKYFYPFLFTSFYVELLSGVMNFRKPNDLGRISLSLGTDLFTLSVIFVMIHLCLVYNSTKKNQYSVKFVLTTALLIITVSSLWTLANQMFKIRIL